MMDDIAASIIVLILGLVIGFIVGSTAASSVVNSDCEKYGSYTNEKYKMTCEVRK